MSDLDAPTAASLEVRPPGPRAPRPDVSLADRYGLLDGTVFLSGVQALVRSLLDQHRADAAAGLRTGTLISGYQGSPLGGFDQEVHRLRELAVEHHLVLRPGINEELGATAVWGSQLAGTLPGHRYDGVTGVWYGKSPGVDRSADAIRHGNFVGTDPRGGVLALCGDDPACKSSTIPGASESLLAALGVPVLAPSDVQEALDLSRHAIACSRASGLWTALKVVTAVADATATVDVGLDRVRPIVPVLEDGGRPYVHAPSAHLLAPQSIEMERTLTGVRFELAKQYGRENGLNVVRRDDPGARLGIVASGAAYQLVVQALAALEREQAVPLRVLQVGMLYPFDERAARDAARGLDEVLVVEEKTPFLERLVKDALYGMADRPHVTGERDDQGRPLVPTTGALDVDQVVRAIGARLLARADLPGVEALLREQTAIAERPAADVGATRAPAFCAGCPHNSSLVAPDGELVGAGIGCHTMVLMAPKGRGQVTGLTQMGGEGVQWLGVAPFVDTPHFTQNLGDGTFHHSGSLAVRAAVAAGLNVTYKLLYNDTVAMTGGQQIVGQMSVAAVAASLAAEGVTRIVVTTEDRSRYDGVELPAIAELRDRSELLRTQRELASVPGVTVLIHDQACATELRRARKRGTVATPPQRVVINERVCEGCGDCGVKSSCLAVEPVQTEFGRKTRINDASCNSDFSCLEGDCPSFLTVIPPKDAAHRAPLEPPADLPLPARRVPDDDVRIRFVGIGGTGVVTVSQVLGMAALLDGRHAKGLDQTGLSQKAGPVVSDLRITRAAATGAAAPSSGGTDLLLGLDLLGAASAGNLRTARPERTVAVVSTSVVPTAKMVVDVHATPPDAEAARTAIDAVTRTDENVYVDTRALSDAVFGDQTPANVILLGAAWQQGAIPVDRDALRRAFELNGVGVEDNLRAFEWGRAAVADPATVGRVLAGGGSVAPAPSPNELALIDTVAPEPGELRRLLEVRVPDLVGWGGLRTARRYVERVAEVAAVERERAPGSLAVTEAFAVGLHKLTAYKDEYEIARLHLIGLADLPAGAKTSFHLHPPLLRALGLRRKLRLGGWFVPAFRLLRRLRPLRGTPLDVFGYARVRRTERRLPDEYVALVDRALAQLDAEHRDAVVAVAETPDLVRGYEEIKLANVERFREQAATALTVLEQGSDAPSPLTVHHHEGPRA